MTRADWSFPTAIRFGAGLIAEFGEACHAAGIARPLLVTDPGIANLPIAGRALDVLAGSGLEAAVFAGVDANPTGENVEAGLVAYRAGGHDRVVAFGGGSALDCGKAVAFMQGQTLPVWEFEDVSDRWRRADPAGIAPVVAVPTTAGTGSEVGRSGVILDTEAQVKKVIFHPDMLPREVIAEPELMLGLPPALTAGTGMGALAHCLEAYCAPAFHPMAEGIAVEGKCA